MQTHWIRSWGFGALLALPLLAGAGEPPAENTGGAASAFAAAQRQLLVEYVDCMRGVFASGADHLPEAGAAALCARERAAYAASLPEEIAPAILERIDLGPRTRGAR